MKIKNNKAFTMIEILAVVTILGIIMTIAAVSISRILEKSKNEYYKNQKDNVILATQSFIQDNTDKLPKNIGQTVKINLNELVSQKYLKEAVKDYDKKKCNMDTSYVEITKISQKDYSYNVYLDCPAYTDKLENKLDKAPSISISFTGANYKEAKVKLTIQGNDKLVSYNYIIYYRENSASKYREIKNSGSIAVNEKSSVSFTEDIASYLPGEVKVQVSATNSYGKTKNANNSHNYIDVGVPRCIYNGNEYVEGSTNHIPWSKDTSKTISIGCEDDDVGCVQDVYTKTFYNSGEYGEIVIADKNGNKTTCKVALYLDNTKPSCGEITGAGTTSTWINSTRDVSVECKDKHSGCTKNSFGKSYSVSNGNKLKEGTIIIQDNAGNTNSCTVGVYIEKIPPKCGTVTNEGSSVNWRKSRRNITVECTDNDSGCPHQNVTKTITATKGESITYDKITISDKAGNQTKCTVKAYLDYKSPTCTSCSVSDWRKDSATCSVECSDSDSGCEEKLTPVTLTKSGSKNVIIYDKVGNSTTCQASAMIDNKGPTCAGYSINSSTASRCIISFKCSDTESGCRLGITKGYASYPTTVVSVNIYDNAGNTTTCKAPAVYRR